MMLNWIMDDIVVLFSSGMKCVDWENLI